MHKLHSPFAAFLSLHLRLHLVCYRTIETSKAIASPVRITYPHALSHIHTRDFKYVKISECTRVRLLVLVRCSVGSQKAFMPVTSAAILHWRTSHIFIRYSLYVRSGQCDCATPTIAPIYLLRLVDSLVASPLPRSQKAQCTCRRWRWRWLDGRGRCRNLWNCWTYVGVIVVAPLALKRCPLAVGRWQAAWCQHQADVQYMDRHYLAKVKTRKCRTSFANDVVARCHRQRLNWSASCRLRSRALTAIVFNRIGTYRAAIAIKMFETTSEYCTILHTQPWYVHCTNIYSCSM